VAYAYFDTSALMKRYVDEPGRREVLQLLRKNDCVVSAILPVEVRSALRRRVVEGRLDERRVRAVAKRFTADRAFWTVIEVSRDVLAAAETLSAAHSLRALDAIHVASAQLFAARIVSSALTFVSADMRQTTAAAASGMTIRHIES
jgi:predicted nucleic acid-binding protein